MPRTAYLQGMIRVWRLLSVGRNCGLVSVIIVGIGGGWLGCTGALSKQETLSKFSSSWSLSGGFFAASVIFFTADYRQNE